MQPTDEQIKQLMTTVSCAVCGSNYQPGSIDVIGHRDELWFLRVSCAMCATSGLVAAVVKGTEAAAEREIEPAAPEPSPELDLARAPGPITRGDVLGMRRFLARFDGDFKALFGDEPEQRPHRTAA